MNGRDGTTAFLPLDSKIGGQVGHDRPNVMLCMAVLYGS